ncbi:MAG: hypothetical protein GC178_09500 [Flavobacteriales bacterium]|nr:hypothetical protein [Flavobacteriales bacterium]
MKRIVFLALIASPLISFGQRTMKDFMNENCDVVWFGLDFTKARMIGEEGFHDPVAIKEDYFRKWNHLMISEGDKYEWGKALLIADLKYDYGVVDVVNDQVKVKSLVINKSYSISEDDIKSAVKAYTIEDYKDGIGIVILVESFDKIKEQGFGYLTFFDIGTKQVLYTHKLIGDASGFGFRNYWAGAIYNWLKYTRGRVMKDIKKEFK